VITPRTTRLVRVPDLQAFQRAIVGALPRTIDAVRDCTIIVPTHGAAEELRRTIENVALRSPGAAASAQSRATVVVLPELLTRDQFYARMRERMPDAPALLSGFSREVLLRRAARDASAAGAEPPFQLRPGLIVEILALYDELRRRHKTVADFERLLIASLAPSADHDRGAARLLQQTVFLASTFTRFEAAVAATGLLDEHTLRLRARQPSPGARPLVRHVVVTVADQAADRRGLWTADFDLLARLPGLESIDVIATEALLESGFHQRLHDLMPGIEEVRGEAPASLPVLMVPQRETRTFVCRDREEELAEFARAIKSEPRRVTPLDRTAIVFQRPLPYLYLARQVFSDARIPYQALDSMPLAAEPFAAAVDLIFAAIAANFTRGSLIELLRSPHFTFTPSPPDGVSGLNQTPPASHAIAPSEIAALDRFLVERKYLGSAERLAELSSEAGPDARSRYISALAAAAAVAAALTRVSTVATAPEQIALILAFIKAHERLPRTTDAWRARHLRARGAVLAALEMLRDAHAAHDLEPLSIAELAGAVRRWIEGQTFSPRTGAAGLVLLDARAAAYADLDEIRIVGLDEADWPERATRSIFYPQSLLSQLGWPLEQDRAAAGRAQFQDLLRLSKRRVSLSTFTLEDDALVSASPLLDDIDAVGLPIEQVPARASMRAFAHEALAIEPVAFDAVDGTSRRWLTLRAARTFDEERFRGAAGPRSPVPYAVSHVERYIACPFRYYAAYVLRLPEERDEESWMTPQERGQLVHEVFCEFFTEWQARGGGAITTANLGEAVELFGQVAETHLESLPEGDRALERTLLLGSAAAPGLAERAFAFEVEQGVPVLERLLEYELEDVFTFAGPDGPRTLHLRSKADRIDLLHDGTLRIIDYKLGRAPNRDRSLQLPVYGTCAQQALKGRHNREWTVSRAGYVAFREKQAFSSLGKSVDDIAAALADGQARLVAAVESIERGEFPVRPDEPYLCNWCAYPTVCRKDYVGDE
jgi:RecB family exonuclease